MDSQPPPNIFGTERFWLAIAGSLAVAIGAESAWVRWVHAPTGEAVSHFMMFFVLFSFLFPYLSQTQVSWEKRLGFGLYMGIVLAVGMWFLETVFP